MASQSEHTDGRLRRRRKRDHTGARFLKPGLPVLFILTCLVYLPVFQGNVVWTDHAIMNGTGFGSSSPWAALVTPIEGAYRPLAGLSLYLDWSFHGQNISGWLLTGILLHAIAVVLVAMIGGRLLKSGYGGLASGLLFAIHPCMVSATAWLSGRAELLGCVFVAGYILCLLIFFESEDQRWLIGGIGCLVLACLATPGACLLALLAPLIGKVAGRHRQSWRRSLFQVRSVLVVGVALVALYPFVQPSVLGVSSITITEIMNRIAGSATNYCLVLIGLQRDPLFTFTIADYRQPDMLFVGASLFLVMLGVAAVSLRKVLEWSILACGFTLAYLAIANVAPMPGELVEPFRTATACMFMCLFVGWIASKTHWTLALGLAVAWAWVGIGSIPTWRNEMAFFDVVTDVDAGCLDASLSDGRLQLQAGNASDALSTANQALAWVLSRASWESDLDRVKQMDLERVKLNEPFGVDPRVRVADLLELRADAEDKITEEAAQSRFTRRDAEDVLEHTLPR